MADQLAHEINAFLTHMANHRRIAPNTVAAYQNDLNQFHGYVQSMPNGASTSDQPGGPDLRALDAGTLAGFVLHLREKHYAEATVARKVAAVKSFFNYAAEAGLVADNPAAALDSPRVQRIMPHAVSPNHVHALLEVGCAGRMPDALRNRAMLTLLYHSGMRVSEMVALDAGDIDLQKRVVRCRGRVGRVRQIPLTEPARAALEIYLASGRAALARADEDDIDALFLNHRGTRLTRQGFWLIMKECARHAGIAAPITPHTLRHSFALHQLGRGTTLTDLKELLGHVNLSTTQVYALADRGAPAPA
ncbi:MAG: tyrosine-type recombinase/integrase [Chloroflexi bacterium]|nr:tyrosine-type recombinase/integrase [Chloroflexota bacterium]